jgi:hypothetical protein
MKGCCLFCFCMLFMGIIVRSQTRFWTGRVFSENRTAISGATILIRSKDSSRIISYAISGADGYFFLHKKHISSGEYIVEIKHVSYRDIQRLVSVVNGEVSEEAWDFILIPEQVELKEVLIEREKPLVIRSDTIQFNAGSFRTPETRKLEDLLKNIRGFSVDAQGRLSFNGKSVEKVLIDGDDLAGKGYRLITRNLSAAVVDQIQVIDNYNDNRLLRDVEKRDKVGINLKISSGFRNKMSGNLSAGVAREKRYLADGSIMFIGKPIKLLSIIIILLKIHQAMSVIITTRKVYLQIIL